MKIKILAACFYLIIPFSIFAHGSVLTDHSKIKESSSFKIMGSLDLRTQKDISSEAVYRTLNHEGGMQVKVLEILQSGVYEEKSGLWLYVRLTSPIWVDSGEWIEKYRKFLIFLPDDMSVFDFE